MRRELLVAAAVVEVAGVFCAAALPAQVATAEERALRESLRSADMSMSGFSAMKGFVRSYGDVSGDFVMLIEGAPIVRGRDAVLALLEAQRRFAAMRVSWQPFRVLISSDGTLGVTFGATALSGPNLDQHSLGRYVSVWRRGAGDQWQLAAQVQTGLIPAAELALPTGAVPGALTGAVPGALTGATPRDPFALADLAFAQLARDSTAPVAFARFSAPNGMTFGGTGELNVGPSDIQARLSEGPAGRATWRWAPVLTIAAASGDLGVTIGEAEIAVPGGSPTTLSKYLTVWQRQPDGALKYVVDAGNPRPLSR
jgi:ketosteroid isomerase-like protein